MDIILTIQNAIDYVEENITEKLNYEEIAKKAYFSSFHFQRLFGITCGLTLGEYIRRRRLTLAGQDLKNANIKVVDVAFKYGYDSPESFSRAFYKFHGVTPSKVKKGFEVKFFSPIKLNLDLSGENKMNYQIKELPEIVLVGYKSRFHGVPFGEDRASQEKEFLTSTRAKQWLLLGASCDYSTDYMVIKNIDDEGYDFYVAYELDKWTRDNLFNPQITGVDFIDKLGFETVVIPKQKYVVFETEKKKRPIADYLNIRKKIVSDWIPKSSFVFANAPELVIMHWRPKGEWEKERYIEICLPIENS